MPNWCAGCVHYHYQKICNDKSSMNIYSLLTLLEIYFNFMQKNLLRLIPPSKVAILNFSFKGPKTYIGYIRWVANHNIVQQKLDESKGVRCKNICIYIYLILNEYDCKKKPYWLRFLYNTVLQLHVYHIISIALCILRALR